jgi:hypothetical protein
VPPPNNASNLTKPAQPGWKGGAGWSEVLGARDTALGSRQVGSPADLPFLAAADDRDLAVPAGLGADRVAQRWKLLSPE